MNIKYLKLLLGTGMIIAVLFFGIWNTNAHSLIIDGSIGAVLHVDPDDDPIARDPAIFSLDFKDKNGKLDLKKCNCSASIVSNGSPLYSTLINTDKNVVVKNNRLQFAYTFPTKGIYTVVIEGKPAEDAAFQSFKLSYDIRVDREASGGVRAPSALGRFLGDHGIHYILFGGAVLLSIFLVIRDNQKKKEV